MLRAAVRALAPTGVDARLQAVSGLANLLASADDGRQRRPFWKRGELPGGTDGMTRRKPTKAARRAISPDEVGRQERAVREWPHMPADLRHRMVQRCSGGPMIPALEELVVAETERLLEASRPSELDLAFGFIKRLVLDRAIAGGDTITITASVDAITARLVVGTETGVAARFELTGDELTNEIAVRRMLAARGQR